jgi:hypothetical protein
MLVSEERENITVEHGNSEIHRNNKAVKGKNSGFSERMNDEYAAIMT